MSTLIRFQPSPSQQVSLDRYTSVRGSAMEKLRSSLILLLCTIAGISASSRSLSVTNYGSLQISTVKHGDKYATNRACYSFEDVSPKYHGATHVRGLNDKSGDITFSVNVPVRVYLAIDSRYPYIHGSDYQVTGDYVMLGGCHSRTVFYIYKSARVYNPGQVRIHFKASRMTAIFLRDARVVRPDAELSLSFPAMSQPVEISMVRDGEKFSTNRDGYTMVDIPPKYDGLTHIRGPNDNKIFMFDVNIPVIVYVAVDSRYSNVLPKAFRPNGDKIVHAGTHPRTNFPIYEREYPIPGRVAFSLSDSRMLTVFVKPML